MPNQPRSILHAVLIAAALSLAVNLVRLYGELQKWAPAVFNTEGGGGGSPLGISWLVIVFGFWFGRRLAQNGHRPASTGKSLLLCLAGVGVMVGAAYVAFTFIGPPGVDAVLTDDEWRLRSLVFNGGAAAGGLLLLAGWARAWFVLVFYGLLARVPVIVIQFIAIENQWDTHFSKGPPGMQASVLPFALTIAQAVLWPFGFTVLVGGLFATLGAWSVRRAG
ncbi:MAG: hypothetical protein Q7T30_02770 [Planctomycetota bacterium]|nr:hypothetical protein [Planctomycetota bacterium]